MEESRPKIIVTGGAGYIGSHTVVELINAGYEPIIVDNFSNSREEVLQWLNNILGRSVKCYKVDCCDAAKVKDVFDKEGPVFGVIHFAAFKAVGESVEKPDMYFENNVGSLDSMLQVMQEHQVKNIVFSSSCTVYGQPDSLPVTEQTPMKPAESPYGETKQVCEQRLQEVNETNQGTLNTAILRYFNPIGAHESGSIGELPLGVPNNLVPYIALVAAKRLERLTVYGGDYQTADGTCIRDYIHVVDLAKAHVKALEWLKDKSNQCEVFNIGTGNGNSVLEMVQAFEQVNKLKLNYVMGERRPGDVEQIYANADKAWQVLNWRAELGIEEALRDVWRWQQNEEKDAVVSLQP